MHLVALPCLHCLETLPCYIATCTGDTVVRCPNRQGDGQEYESLFADLHWLWHTLCCDASLSATPEQFLAAGSRSSPGACLCVCERLETGKVLFRALS